MWQELHSSPEVDASLPRPAWDTSEEASLGAARELLWKPPSTSCGAPEALDGSDEAPEGEGLSLLACPSSLHELHAKRVAKSKKAESCSGSPPAPPAALLTPWRAPTRLLGLQGSACWPQFPARAAC